MVEVLGSREFSALLGANMAVTRKVLKGHDHSADGSRIIAARLVTSPRPPATGPKRQTLLAHIGEQASGQSKENPS